MGYFTNYTQTPRPLYNPNWFQNFSNGLTPFARGMFNQQPELGFEHWLKWARLAPTQEATMRNIADLVAQRWQSQQLVNSTRGGAAQTDWIDTINNTDWTRELARYTPQQRRESPQQFMRPTRTITWS